METGIEPVLETPELEQLLQQQRQVLAVPVRLTGPAEVHTLPNRTVQHSTDAVGSDWVAIAPETPKRAVALLVAMTDDIYIKESTMGGGSIWPKLVPYRVTHTKPIFVKAANTNTLVGSTLELWAD